LRNWGFRICDLNTYKEIYSSKDFSLFPESLIRNIVCLREGVDEKYPYFSMAHSNIVTMDNSAFSQEGLIYSSSRQDLGAGRYVSTLNFEFTTDAVIAYRVVSAGDTLSLITGPCSTVQKHYADLPFHLFEYGSISIEIELISCDISSDFMVRGCKIIEVTNFNELSRPLCL
jgi:hypothetical protein